MKRQNVSGIAQNDKYPDANIVSPLPYPRTCLPYHILISPPQCTHIRPDEGTVDCCFDCQTVPSPLLPPVCDVVFHQIDWMPTSTPIEGTELAKMYRVLLSCMYVQGRVEHQGYTISGCSLHPVLLHRMCLTNATGLFSHASSTLFDTFLRLTK